MSGIEISEIILSCGVVLIAGLAILRRAKMHARLQARREEFSASFSVNSD